MSTHRPPPPPAQPDALEFELTDFTEARLALDELPPGVASAHTLAPGYWDARRRRPVPTDRALTGQAIDWLLRLPPDARPRVTSERYPRIVNALAAAWPYTDDRRELLHSLLHDRRPQRSGFPDGVRTELELLLQMSASGARNDVPPRPLPPRRF